MNGEGEEITTEVIKSHITGVARKIQDQDTLLNFSFSEMMTLSLSYTVISLAKCDNATYPEVISCFFKKLTLVLVDNNVSFKDFEQSV